MKLLFKTSNPKGLYSEIISIIESGELDTWTIYKNKNVKYLKHTKQWGEKGVIEINLDIPNNQVKVQVLKFEGTEEDIKDFEGYYLGRFCEIIFVNFPKGFQSINKE